MSGPNRSAPPSAGSGTALDWAPGLAVGAFEVRRDPNGVLQRSVSARTTRGTFDSTEQGFWAPLADAPGSPAVPIAHKSTHAAGGTDPLSPADIGAATAADATNNAAAIADETTRALAAEAALLAGAGGDTRYAPQKPGFVATADPRTVTGSGGMSATNQMRGSRVIIPRSGTLVDLSLWIVVNTSGNLDLGILDTSATTRNRLFATGATAASGLTANAWWTVNPNLAVTQGEELDFTVAADTTVPTFARLSAGNWCSLPANFWPVAGGGAPKLAWLSGTGAATIPATYAEGSLNPSNVVPLIVARVV